MTPLGEVLANDLVTLCRADKADGCRRRSQGGRHLSQVGQRQPDIQIHTGDADVSLEGTLVRAVGGASAATVNGVAFQNVLKGVGPFTHKQGA